jgi:hypothetical protein
MARQFSNSTNGVTSVYYTNSTQNLYDVCLMTLGDLNKIVMLAESNNFDSINSTPNGVIAVNYNNADITNEGFMNAMRKSNINIITGGIVAEEIVEGLLLLESGFNLLQEDGFKIEL